MLEQYADVSIDHRERSPSAERFAGGTSLGHEWPWRTGGSVKKLGFAIAWAVAATSVRPGW